MSILRLYELEASPEEGASLEAALEQLAESVRALPGCVSVQVLRDRKSADAFVFMETWSDEEAYAQGGKLLDKAALKAVMAAVARPPVTRELVVC